MKVPTMNQEFLDHNEPPVRVQIELVGSKCRLTIVDHENFEFFTLDFKELELKVYHRNHYQSSTTLGHIITLIRKNMIKLELLGTSSTCKNALVLSYSVFYQYRTPQSSIN